MYNFLNREYFYTVKHPMQSGNQLTVRSHLYPHQSLFFCHRQVTILLTTKFPQHFLMQNQGHFFIQNEGNAYMYCYFPSFFS